MTNDQLPKPEDVEAPASHVEDVIFTNRRLHVSVRGVLALLITTTTCVMALRGLDVKEPLYSLAIFVLGFFFGTRGLKR